MKEQDKGFYQKYREDNNSIPHDFFINSDYNVDISNFTDTAPTIGDMIKRLDTDLTNSENKSYIERFITLLLKGTGFEEFKEIFNKYPNEITVYYDLPQPLALDLSYTVLTSLIINTKEYSLKHCDSFYMYGGIDDAIETYFLGTKEPDANGYSPGLVDVYKSRSKQHINNMIQDSIDYLSSPVFEEFYEDFPEMYQINKQNLLDKEDKLLL